jgi:ATP-dependent protease ClpP protease subunit
MNLIQIENKSGKVKLTEDINRYSVEKVIDDIGKLFGASAHASGADFGEITMSAENAVDTLEIEINSPGGSIFDGYNIYKEILSLRGRGVVVTAVITGMAASMASVICMACDRVEMVKHGRMMIHEASQTVRGNSDELRKAADLLGGISSDIANIYAEKTGKTQGEIREMMKAETWMNFDDALKNGFVDGQFDIGGAKPKNMNMSIFAKLFPGNDDALKIEAAILENDSLRADLTDAQAKITELSGLSAVIADKDAEIVALADTKAVIETELATIKAELETAKAEIETVKESSAAQAVAILAAAGQLAAIEGDPQSSGKSISRAEFNNLNPSDAMAFCKSGGKITA